MRAWVIRATGGLDQLDLADVPDPGAGGGPATLGPREVRSYQLAGTTFILVLEPFERGGAQRVAGIYMQ